VAISLDDRREPKVEPSRTSWNGVVESGLRFLPLLGAALLGDAYRGLLLRPWLLGLLSHPHGVHPGKPDASRYSVCLGIPHCAGTSSVCSSGPDVRAVADGSEEPGSRPWPFVLFLVAVGVAGRLRGEFSWTDVITTAVVMYILLWGFIPAVWLGLRWITRRMPAGRFVWRPVGIAMAAIWRHIFGKTPDLRGSRVLAAGAPPGPSPGEPLMERRS
jgi:hypothetical protein